MPYLSPRTLTQTEQELILRVTAAHPRDHAIFSLALGTGLRLGEILVLDDFGLPPLRPPGPEDLYEVIDARYEKGSIVLTSNRDRSEWPDTFGETLLASAAFDRVVHRAHLVEITGQSFRAGHKKAHAEKAATEA